MIDLRPLQVRTVRAVHEAIGRFRRIMIVCPTGSGKRILAVWWLLKASEKGRKSLVITDRKQLVRQMADECERSGVDHGVVMASEALNLAAPVQIASLQTLRSRKWKGLPEADLVIVDECHKESRAYHTLFDLYPDAVVLGFTATPAGAQGRTLIGLYDHMVEGMKNTELLDGGWLLRTKVYAPFEPDVEGVSFDKRVSVSGGREFNQTELARVVEDCIVFADVFKWWLPLSDMATICFAPKLKYAHGICSQFTGRGIPAEVIEGRTTASDRVGIFDRFESGETRVLVSVDVMKEGVDLPIAQVGIDLQPNHQFRTYWQKCGRIRRTHAGQDKCYWLDFAGNTWRFYHPDSDPPWDEVVGSKSTQDMPENRPRKQEESKRWNCTKCRYVLAYWERLRDGKCPNCGAQIGKPTRRIVMKDGRMREVTIEDQVEGKEVLDQKEWVSCLFIASNRNGTMNMARAIFKSKTGRWPAANLKNCPSYHHPDWKRKVRRVLPWTSKRSVRR